MEHEEGEKKDPRTQIATITKEKTTATLKSSTSREKKHTLAHKWPPSLKKKNHPQIATITNERPSH